jgi:hypothetical protein
MEARGLAEEDCCRREGWRRGGGETATAVK